MDRAAASLAGPAVFLGLALIVVLMTRRRQAEDSGNDQQSESKEDDMGDHVTDEDYGAAPTT